MSFIDDVVSFGSTVFGAFTGGSIFSQVARTAITGFALSQLSNSINKENSEKTVNPGIRLQVDASTEHNIPVVYGEAWLGGIITDAVLTEDQQTMFYCLTLSEKTGKLNLGQGAQSTFSFGEIYRDDMKLLFGADGFTVSGVMDREGNICTKPAGKIRVYCYAGNSVTPVAPLGGLAGGAAYAVMPGWTSSHMMNDLVFAIVRIDYDAKNDITGLGTFKFQVKNTMTLPGDCLFDYMTNTRYGAGLPAGSIQI